MDEQDNNPGRVVAYEKLAPTPERGRAATKDLLGEGLHKKKRPMQIRVRVYFGDVDDSQEFEQIAKEAEIAKCRPPGLVALLQRKHGAAGEMVANTDGIAEYLKKCRDFYVKTEHLRLAEAARIARERAALDEAEKKMGML